jgi:hypothetical protein
MPTRPHRCASCATIGRLSTADPDVADERPVLRLNWNITGGGVALLCDSCATPPDKEIARSGSSDRA